jgi:hypothetical protein
MEDLKWYTVTYRAPAEMVVWVLAKTPDDARMRAEEGQYDDATDIEFLKGRAYTMKVKRAPNYEPPDRSYY